MRGRMVHDLGNAQKLLRQARGAAVGERVHGLAERIHNALGFAPRGEVTFVRSENEQALAATRSGSARLESANVRRNIGHTVRQQYRPGRKLELYTALELPTRDVYREWRGIADAHKLLSLVSR